MYLLARWIIRWRQTFSESAYEHLKKFNEKLKFPTFTICLKRKNLFLGVGRRN